MLQSIPSSHLEMLKPVQHDAFTPIVHRKLYITYHLSRHPELVSGSHWKVSGEIRCIELVFTLRSIPSSHLEMLKPVQHDAFTPIVHRPSPITHHLSLISKSVLSRRLVPIYRVAKRHIPPLFGR